MSTATTARPNATPRGGDGFSLRRLATLTRWNLVLLGRNRLALFYGTVLPLAGLLLLLAGERGDVTLGATAIGGVLLVAGLFPVYYNVLSQFVSRRDELVLKRMRTGEARDSELLIGVALPGIACAALVTAVAVPVAAALGQPMPVNPALYAGGAILSAAMFAALAYWTAAWTRSAEAAQLTSLPVIMLAVVGPVVAPLSGIPDAVREIASWTPGSAINELVRVGWFGLDGSDATTSTLSFADTWELAVQPAAALLIWTALGLQLAARSMRWEPRA